MSLAHHDVAIVGSGFAGLGMAIALRREGIEDFVVLERAAHVGGTWRDNHYPGCACDVPTPLYSFSFAANPDWSHLYAHHEEIRAYLEDCTDRFGVRPHLRLGANMTGAEWDEDRQRWIVELDDRPALTARLLIGGFGGLSRPSFPAIEGLENFQGALFHSAQWDHDVPLEDKRVAVIGTGASAIQLIPQIARQATRVDVFQRTPPWVLPKLDRRISRTEKWLFRRVPATQRALRGVIFAITEGVGYPITRRPRALAGLEAVARRHLDRQVSDPTLRRRLTPSYRLGCKRILVSNDYYPALGRENVEVVTDPILRANEYGIVTSDGVEHPADVLVCSTGFRIEDVFLSLDIRGRDGLSLQAAWADGIEAHRGTTVAGFPNLALLSGPNTGTGSTSQVYMIEAQIRFVMQALRTMRTCGSATFEVRPEAQRTYNQWLQQRMKQTVWLQGGCNSWYLDDAGVNRTLYPGLSSSFRRSLRQFHLDEHLLTPAHAPQHEREPIPVANA
jgi:cation diffusion facilitator CzcD-associated flavoprotein CzcO